MTKMPPTTFIDMNSAVEVDASPDVPDDDDMMEDDAMTDIAEDKASSSSQQPTPPQDSAAPPIADQSRATFSSHADAIYAIASHYDIRQPTRYPSPPEVEMTAPSCTK